MISPIRFTDEHLQKLKSVDTITDIVAPCLLHHLSVPIASNIYPHAQLWGVKGFDTKRPDIKWNHTLSEHNWPYSDEIDIITIEGIPSINECVFFHKESRTLILTDLCFHLMEVKGFLAKLLLRFLGTYKKFALSRLFKVFVKDRQAFTQSLKKILEWDFDRVIVGHGAIIERDGKLIFRNAIRIRGFDV